MNTSQGTLGEVEAMARDFVDKGRFKTMPLAKAYIYETRPHLAEQVRAETNAAYASGAEQAHVGTLQKAAPVTGALADVEKRARQLVDKGAHPTIEQARAHIYESEPATWDAVRAQIASLR